MTRKRPPERDRPTRWRVTAAGTAGLVVAIAMATTVGWPYATAAGWTVTAAVFTGWTWRVIGGLGPRETAAHATREGPARPVNDLITLNACIASLAGVYLLAAGSSGGAVEVLAAALGIASVVGAWLVVHTVYTTVRVANGWRRRPGPAQMLGPAPQATDQSAADKMIANVPSQLT